MRLASGLLILWALVAAPSPATAADSLRCGGRLVERGDLALTVIDRCGEPDYVDAWPATRVGARVYPSGIEQWYYNFGPARLIQILRFEEGRLQRVSSGDHGFSGTGAQRCRPLDILPTLSKYRLLALCGEPDQSQSAVVHGSSRHFGGRGTVLAGGLLLRERWYYNFGGAYLLREVLLENGRVVRVDTIDERGFDPR
jgi:hypothetical protein